MNKKRSAPTAKRSPFQKNLRILWVTDPWHTLDHAKDTTLRLAQECRALGAQCFWAEPAGMTLDDKRTRIIAQELRGFAEPRSEESVERSTPTMFGLPDFTHIYYRVDPPVDLHYMHPLYLLHRAIPFGRPEVQAPLEVLLAMSEKIVPQELEQYAPATRVATRFEDFQTFGQKHRVTIAKPLHAAQSQGVVRLDWKNSTDLARAKEALASLTENFSRPALLQEYLPEISNGEVRLWFIDGRFLASVRKKPAAGQTIINMDQGGTLGVHHCSDSEKKTAQNIGRWLAKNHIRMAAVDLIHGKITDLNFTSPGLLVGMEQVTGRPLAREVARALCTERTRK